MGPAAAILAAALAIVPAAHHHRPPVKVVVSETYHGRIDVAPPTRLDVVMVGSDRAAVVRCLDMGGEPILYPRTWSYRPLRGVLVCEGVDY